MVKAVGFNGCKISLASISIQYLNTMIIYMVIIINVFIFYSLALGLCAVAPSGRVFKIHKIFLHYFIGFLTLINYMDKWVTPNGVTH